jgi:hypothetical protein
MDENLNISNVHVLCLQGFCAGSDIPELYSTVSRSRCKQCSFTTKTTAGYINQEHISRNHIIISKSLKLQVNAVQPCVTGQHTSWTVTGRNNIPPPSQKECNSSFWIWTSVCTDSKLELHSFWDGRNTFEALHCNLNKVETGAKGKGATYSRV